MNATPLHYTDSEKIKFLEKLGYTAEKIEYKVLHGETAHTKAFETKEYITIVYKGQISTPLSKLIKKRYKIAEDFKVYSNELLHSAFEREFSRLLLQLLSSSII